MSQPSFAARRAALRQRLKARDKGLLVAPGIYDLITARIADTFGFEALYMTGYGVSASYLGVPDAGFATYTDMENRVRTISNVASTPLIADGDTGYGGALNVMHTIRGYERAGAAAIQIEDQEFPKRCGHTLGRRVLPMEDMVLKLRVAVDTREDPNFLIIARTDARTTLGLDEALRRGEAYVKAGADVLFVESPESEEEMARICRHFDVPLLANMVESGRTPVLSREKLEQLGYALAIFPTAAFLSAGAVFQQVYTTLKEQGSTAGSPIPMADFQSFSRQMGFAEVWDFDKKYGSRD
ncbi:isocitrate lyase/PEP mutase family protein [Ferrovibrio sp. MS7]|uniref:isocitrate lyase/PEP mutase family protein n=1 Tax=Ferrovibrio plantarum TaxID=3119164 RepID=UPI00313555EF